MTDQFGNELKVGDIFVHVTKRSTDVIIKYGIIRSMENNKLQVTMVRKKYEWQDRAYKLRRYNVTLRKGKNLLKLTLPKDVLDQLFNT